MRAMKRRQRTQRGFQSFMEHLQTTHETLAFYTDFTKCRENLHRVSVKLYQLNYLLGRSDIVAAVREVWRENPSAFEVLSILIAVRDGKGKKVVDGKGQVRRMADYFKSPEAVVEFISRTGLREVFERGEVTNLADYVFGVEVGLDTNARKNRSGRMMAACVREMLTDVGLPFEEEVESSLLVELQNALGTDVKRFDFVVSVPRSTYVIETNFYTGGGSKLNEVARSYVDLARSVNSVRGYEFVWITDGAGWRSAKNKLEEAYYAIPHLYNLHTLETFVQLLRASRGKG